MILQSAGDLNQLNSMEVRELWYNTPEYGYSYILVVYTKADYLHTKKFIINKHYIYNTASYMVQQVAVDSTIEVYTSIMLYSCCTQMCVYAHAPWLVVCLTQVHTLV